MKLWLALKPNLPGFVQFARGILAQASPQAKFAAGTEENFAELNRNRPPSDANWMTCFPINPQVHAKDAMTVMENLAAQPETIKTVQSFSKHKAVISPITLLPCAPSCQDATGKPFEPAADPRHESLFAAAWTLGSLAELLPTEGLNSLTFYHTTGPGGLMTTDASRVYPLYFAFAGVAHLNHVVRPQITSRDKRKTAALAGLTSNGERVIWLGNLTPAESEIQLKLGDQTGSWKVKELNQANVASAVENPDGWLESSADRVINAERENMVIPPFGLVRLTS